MCVEKTEIFSNQRQSGERKTARKAKVARKTGRARYEQYAAVSHYHVSLAVSNATRLAENYNSSISPPKLADVTHDAGCIANMQPNG